MAKANVSEYDVVAANNTDISSINITGTGLVSTADDSFRANSANLAKWWSDLGGVNTVAGTADAITITTPTVYTALKTGMRFNFKASAANTGAATLNFDAIGAKAIRKISGGVDVALTAGDIPGANARIDLIYDAAANAAAGAWVLLGASVAASSTTDVLTGTGTSNYATPNAIAALWEKGSDEASAGTVSFGEGGFFHITGTTTITDIDFDTAKDGRAVDVVFDGALTLTHNGTTLQLPGAANITTAAGDRARFVQDSSDNVICLWYQRAASAPVTITPWVAYTPTFTNLGTVTSISFFSRRVGSNLEIFGKATGGTPSGAEGRISIGFNGTDGNVASDSTVVPSIMGCGSFYRSFATADYCSCLIEQSKSYMCFGSAQGGGTAPLIKNNGNSMIANNETFSLQASIPIQGW